VSGFELTDAHAYAAALVAAAATYFWRAFGVAIGGRIDPKGWVFEWFASVAYAVLAALVLRLIAFPAGELASLPMSVRLGAAALALATYYLTGRSTFAGCLAGAATIAAAALWFARSVV
jgi:branched-subunit amino acid transport protein